MNIENRNKQIRALRKEGKKTLEQIGVQFNLSRERVRQICKGEPKMSYCKEHECKYITSCRYCTMMASYKTILFNIMESGLGTEIKRLSKPDRRKEVVLQRALLVGILREDKKLSYPTIGRLLNRDHTTIIYLYKNVYLKHEKKIT